MRLKWTHAALAPAITMLPVHHHPIIVIFSAPARLASQEDFAMKTSMNVKRTTHAEMEAPVLILRAATHVNAGWDLREEIV